MPSHGDYTISHPSALAYATSPPESCDGDVGDHHALGSSLELHFSPPGPCYRGLKNNVPLPLMTSTLGPWPEGLESFVRQRHIEEYIQKLALDHGVDAVTSFHTRVDEIRKTPQGTKWEVRFITLGNGEAGCRLVEGSSQFDQVVVASGHFNMARLPDIEGFKAWKTTHPLRLTHSKQYRRAEKHSQNVLLIGAGVSALDICCELDGVANRTYQSVCGGEFDLPQSLVPEKVIRVPEVAEFVLHNNGVDNTPLNEDDPVPGAIVLRDGQVLEGVHHVITATGYITSYPFLPQLQSDHTPNAAAGEELLAGSEGGMTHNLHRDIFLHQRPDPRLRGRPLLRRGIFLVRLPSSRPKPLLASFQEKRAYPPKRTCGGNM